MERRRHRSGGPRPDITADPLDLSGLGKARATRAVRFMEGLHVPKGKGALARHVSNAVLKVDTRGSRLVKESKHSRRRIDLAVAAVMAHSRAVELARRPAPSIYVG